MYRFHFIFLILQSKKNKYFKIPNMKNRLFLLSSFFLISNLTFSQKVNLVIFSEDGDRFFAFVNGIRQNDKAESNVKVTDLTTNVSLRIEFEDKALPQLKQNMTLERGFEHTAKIKRDMKKQLKLLYFGQIPLEESTNNNVPVVAYHTLENSADENYNNSSQIVNDNTYNSTKTSTQLTNTNQNPNDVSININIGGTGLNMNLNGLNNNQNIKTTSSTAVSSSSSSNYNEPRKTNNVSSSNQIQAERNTNISICKSSMTSANFIKMKQSVESKPFSDTKMSTAKVAIKNSCLSANQIIEICKLFSMDEDKLAFAKYAYDYCIDKANYYQIGDIFSFSSTTDDFNEFLEKH